VTALVWSKHPTLTARQIQARLLATLDHKRDSPSADYGYGTLNAYRATLATVPKDAADPVYARAEPFIQREQAQTSPGPKAPAVAGANRAANYGTVRIRRPASTFFTPLVVSGLALIAIAVCGFAALLLLVLDPLGRRTSSSELALAGGAVERADDAAQ
jgi:hypothetical protein